MAGPLTGLRILDFTTLLPAPYATMCLADLGAEVLKVTSGTRPDLAEIIPPFIRGTKLTAAAAHLGRGKKSITLNFKNPKAVRIIHQLVSDYDIVIEQFRPGVMAKYGLDYESLRKVNSAIIYCSLTGYGQTGPLKDRAGHDINYLALSGVMGYSGRKATGPTLMGIPIADVAAGSNNAIIGILAAVISRGRTGRGQHIDISMTDGVMAFNMFGAYSYLVDGKEPEAESLWGNGGSFYDFYETKDGKHISVGSIEPQFFSAFCIAIDRPDLIQGGIDPKNVDEAKRKIREIIKSKTRDQWTDIFEKNDACVEPVLAFSEAIESKYAKERGVVVELDVPNAGKIRQLANPIKFSEDTLEYRWAGCTVGTHLKEVLAGLNYSEDEVIELQKEGVFD